MNVSAQVSLYPLRQEELGPAIDALRLELEREGLELRPGPMSTLVQTLPLRDRSVDLVVFVTTLEFLPSPEAALREATRVARRGVVALVLNRWSAGALSRRVGPQARGALLSRAHDLSLPSLRRLLRNAATERLVGLRWRSVLLPAPLSAAPSPLPLGDVLGLAAELR